MKTSVARARVDALLAAAARLRDPADPLGQRARRELPRATGSSSENVERALACHLEREATDALFEGSARDDEARAPTVHVVLSANVFVAALRAVCLGVIRGDRVIVLPSRREPQFLELLLAALGRTDYVERGLELAPAAHDEVHAYGRDETLARIAARLPQGCGLWRHGAGIGLVAAVDGRGVDVEALADDVAVFDQRGCLSPRIVLARRHGRALAEALATSLRRRLVALPLGEVHDTEREAALAYRRTLEAAGEAFGEVGALVGFVQGGSALFVPTAPRTVHVIESASLPPFLRSHARAFTCVAGDDEEARALLPLARRANVGEMQRPPLDGPVDQREPPPVPVEATAQLAK